MRNQKGFLETEIAWPWVVQEELASLLAALQAANTGVSTCAGIDAVTKAGWAGFYATVLPFAQQQVSFWSFGNGSILDEIEDYSNQLESWQKVLSAKCQVGPLYDAGPTNTPALINLAQWGMFAAIAVAGAYGVGKLAEVAVPLLPERRSASAASERRRRRRR